MGVVHQNRVREGVREGRVKSRSREQHVGMERVPTNWSKGIRDFIGADFVRIED